MDVNDADAASAAAATPPAAAAGSPSEAVPAPPASPGVAVVGLRTSLYIEAVEAMLAALDDYQTDNRGDVGSWVREAAIASLLPMLALGAAPAAGGDGAAPPCASEEERAAWAEVKAERAALDAALPGLCVRFVGHLCQQANEKIDRLREHAALTLIRLLEEKALPAVADSALLSSILHGADRPAATAAATADADAAAAAAAEASAAAASSSVKESSDFLAPHTCFPRTARFLECAPFRRQSLLGLSISAGGITESTTKAASAALLAHLRAQPADLLAAFGDDLVSLMAEHSATPRVFLPLMRTTQALLESRLLEAVLGDGADGDLVTRLIRHVQPASRSKDVPTLLVALHVLVLLLPRAAGAARTDVLRTVVLLLGHRFPKVRKAAADALYVHLITYSDPGELTPLPAADAPPPGAPSPDAAPPAEPPAEPPMEAGEARLELVMGVLLETAWLDALDAHAKPARAKVLAAYGLPPPRVAAAPAASTKPKRAEEDTYKELVGEVGY